MKIKLTRIMAGPDGAFSAGTVIDVDKAQAVALIDAGYAEKFTAPVAAPEPEAEPEATEAPETATAPTAPERAVRHPAKKR